MVKIISADLVLLNMKIFTRQNFYRTLTVGNFYGY